MKEERGRVVPLQRQPGGAHRYVRPRYFLVEIRSVPLKIARTKSKSVLEVPRIYDDLRRQDFIEIDAYRGEEECEA